MTAPLSPQGAVLSQLLRASAHLDGVLLEAVTVLGVTSPPRQVLANGALVSDFSYRSDTQASAHPLRGREQRRGELRAGSWEGPRVSAKGFGLSDAQFLLCWHQGT